MALRCFSFTHELTVNNSRIILTAVLIWIIVIIYMGAAVNIMWELFTVSSWVKEEQRKAIEDCAVNMLIV